MQHEIGHKLIRNSQILEEVIEANDIIISPKRIVASLIRDSLFCVRLC